MVADTKSSSCPGNGQCGTPLASPTHKPKMAADTKSSGCPGNGQCGTPVTSPPDSPVKKLAKKDDQIFASTKIGQDKIFNGMDSKLGSSKAIDTKTEKTLLNGTLSVDKARDSRATPKKESAKDGKKTSECNGTVSLKLDDDTTIEVEVNRRDRSPSPCRYTGGAISKLGEMCSEKQNKVST